MHTPTLAIAVSLKSHLHLHLVDRGMPTLDQHLLVLHMGAVQMAQMADVRASLVQPAVDRIFKTGGTGGADFNGYGRVHKRLPEQLQYFANFRKPATFRLWERAAKPCHFLQPGLCGFS